jgi:hypothetical protein
MGPKDANTGEPRDNVLTAILATILPMSVDMITRLLDFAAFDKVVNPALRLPAKNDCAAAPAFTCEINARAVPVSITFIPKVLGALLRLLLLRRLTMDSGVTYFCYINLRETRSDICHIDYNNGVS